MSEQVATLDIAECGNLIVMLIEVEPEDTLWDDDPTAFFRVKVVDASDGSITLQADHPTMSEARRTWNDWVTIMDPAADPMMAAPTVESYAAHPLFGRF